MDIPHATNVTLLIYNAYEVFPIVNMSSRTFHWEQFSNDKTFIYRAGIVHFLSIVERIRERYRLHTPSRESTK